MPLPRGRSVVEFQPDSRMPFPHLARRVLFWDRYSRLYLLFYASLLELNPLSSPFAGIVFPLPFSLWTNYRQEILLTNLTNLSSKANPVLGRI